MAFKPRPIEAKKVDQFKDFQRVFVATPAYDGRVLTDYAISIAESCLLAPMFGIHVQASIMGNGAFIDLARNTFVRFFLESDAEYLFFIDADLRWEARAFVSLIQQRLPICAGVYPKRQNPEEYPARWMAKPGTDRPWVTKTGDPESGDGESGWLQCDRVPTGFLCIRRDVVEHMVAHSPTQAASNQEPQPLLFAATHFARDGKEFKAVDLINGEFTPADNIDFIGEDFYFSDRYRRMYNKPIPVWADFDFTHGVNWTGNWHKFLVTQSNAEEAKQRQEIEMRVEQDMKRVA